MDDDERTPQAPGAEPEPPALRLPGAEDEPPEPNVIRGID